MAVKLISECLLCESNETKKRSQSDKETIINVFPNLSVLRKHWPSALGSGPILKPEDHLASGCYHLCCQLMLPFKKMEDLEMYSDNLLFNKRQLGPIGQYTV